MSMNLPGGPKRDSKMEQTTIQALAFDTHTRTSLARSVAILAQRKKRLGFRV